MLDLAHKEFIVYLGTENRSSATILAYGKDIEQLVEFLRENDRHEADKITDGDLRDFLTKFEKKGYTQKSLSRKLNAIKTFFKFLKIKGHITNDPATIVAHPKVETKPPRTLSPMEYRSLRDACRDDLRIAAIVEVLLQTGIRISEVGNLRTEDVRFAENKEEGLVYVRSQGTQPARGVPLNLPAEIALKNYLVERPKYKVQGKRKPGEEHVFVTKNGKPLLIRNIRTSIDRYFKKAGIRGAKVNDLRHTWLTHHLAKGISVLILSKLAGHKRLSTTEKYLSLVKNQKEQVKTKLEEI